MGEGRNKDIEKTEKQKITQIVLKLLHTNGIITFDTDQCILDEALEQKLRKEGRDDNSEFN